MASRSFQNPPPLAGWRLAVKKDPLSRMPALPRPRILFADEDAGFARAFQEFLAARNLSVALAASAREAVALVERNPEFRLAFVDSQVPPAGAIALMTQLHRANPSLSVVMMSSVGTPEGAVEAIRCGAEDYLVKPFNIELVAQKAFHLLRLLGSEPAGRGQEPAKPPAPKSGDVFHGSPLMQQILSDAVKASRKRAPILLVGECGVGKDILARAIHAAGPQANGPFLLIDCRTLGRELPDAHPFDSDRASPSTSTDDVQRILEEALGGTLFLNEVGELPPDIQDKLAAAMEAMTRRCRQGEAPPQSAPRILSSTSRPLSEFRVNRLRDALYSLIAGVVLHIPPLRERYEDLIPLIEHFVARLESRYGHPITLGWSTLESLLRHPFPGNVRELESILERAAALAFQTPRRISGGDLRPFLPAPVSPSGASGLLEQSLNLRRSERLAIERALSLCRGNRSKAAALLGIDRTTLYHKLERLNSGKEDRLSSKVRSAPDER